MADLSDVVQETLESSPDARLNSTIALTVALCATFMAICNIKDGNVVQAMAQAQAQAVDQWAYFQAKSTKRALVQSVVDQLTIESEINGSLAPAAREILARKVEFYTGEVARYEKEQAEIRAKAEGREKDYDALNVHDDQFDMAEAGLSVAIALAGITALTRKRWLLILVAVFGGLGVFMGLAGILGWSFHPGVLARMLT